MAGAVPAAKDGDAAGQLGPLRRLALLVLGVWLALCGGTLYAFSAWEVELKSSCHLSAQQLDTVYAAGQIGVGFFGMVVGALHDAFGPVVLALYGLVLTVGGNLGLAAALDHPGCGGLPTMSFLFLVLQNGSCSLYQTGLFSNLRANSHKSQGVVAGTVSAGYGLSAALYSWVFSIGFGQDIQQYFRGTALIFGLSAALGAVAIPCIQGGGSGRSYGRLDDEAEPAPEPSKLGRPVAGGGSAKDVLPSSQTSEGSAVSAGPEPISLREALSAPDLWLFVATFALLQCVGSGIFIANLSLMAESVGISTQERIGYVKMVSYCNCGGRIAAGFVMDALEPRGVPREAHTVWCASAMILISAWLLSVPDEDLRSALSPALAAVGVMYGVVWALMPAFVAGRFGGQHVGVCFNLHAAVMSLSVLVVSRLVGSFYDAAAAGQAEAGAVDFCSGAVCWRGPFTLALVLACLGLLTSLVLTRSVLKRRAAADPFS